MSNASVFEDVRRAIASGEIGPETTLVEAELMARFDAGRPAVRVAIARLEQEGLVEQRPHQSARVRLISAAEALEISEVRGMLEGRAAAKAAGRANDSDVRALRDLLAEAQSARSAGRHQRASELDALLHVEIMRIAADRTIIRVHSGLHGHLVRFHLRTQLEQQHAAVADGEHARIVEAIARHDPAAAEEAMAEHVRGMTVLLERALGDSVSL